MFAILFEVLLTEIQMEILLFAGWEGAGGLRGTKIVNKHFVNKLAFPSHVAGAKKFSKIPAKFPTLGRVLRTYADRTEGKTPPKLPSVPPHTRVIFDLRESFRFSYTLFSALGKVEPEVVQSGFGVNFLFWPGET